MIGERKGWQVDEVNDVDDGLSIDLFGAYDVAKGVNKNNDCDVVMLILIR